jgi:acyl-coenzyme A thioesterase PaaI-like protein
MFIQDLDLECEMAADGATASGEASAGSLLRGEAGGVRPALLATVADIVGGIPACRATAPRLALTLDIAVRIVAQPESDRVRAAARLLKEGRTTVAVAVDFSDARSGDTVALSHLTFVPSPRPQDLAPPTLTGMRTGGSMAVPLPELVGARVPEPGVAEIDHRPYVVQGSGALQGGIVALLAELAAESLAGGPVLDLDTRYLSTVRVGPARAQASPAGGGVVRIEVRDTGAGSRLAAVATARVGPGGAAGGPG